MDAVSTRHRREYNPPDLMRAVVMLSMLAGCGAHAGSPPPATAQPATAASIVSGPRPTSPAVGPYTCALAFDGVWQRPYPCEVKSFYQDGETWVFLDAADSGDAYATDARILVNDGRPWMFGGAYREAKSLRPDEDYGAAFNATLEYRRGTWIGELVYIHQAGMGEPWTGRRTLRMKPR